MSEQTNVVAKAIHDELCGCEPGAHAASYREVARAAINAMRAPAIPSGASPGISITELAGIYADMDVDRTP